MQPEPSFTIVGERDKTLKKNIVDFFSNVNIEVSEFRMYRLSLILNIGIILYLIFE